MIFIPAMIVMFVFAMIALRFQGVCWAYTVLFASVSLALPYFLGLWGFAVAALYVGALWKMELRTM